MRKIEKRPRIGAHLSIGRGLDKTADEAVDRGLETLQIFLRNPRGRGARQFSTRETDHFIEKLGDNNITPLAVHIPYICNPAAVKEDLYQFAWETIQHDLQRCSLVRADFLVLHPGSFTTSSLEAGIERTAALLKRVLSEYQGDTMILLETMAGQGTEIGSNFDELFSILELVDRYDKMGICLDTCHLLAAGYDCSSDRGIDHILEQAAGSFGIDKIRLIHANDSNTPLASRKDRHSHIGQGFIGSEGFARMMQNQLLRGIPFIVETPEEGLQEDIDNLKKLREQITH
ncbi:endonuclease iv [hydrocarbon metagenome]|uniref:Endonuclease iv n=1 Tax=hydrocarbon metagenome TaxID=938273 RepID=A0A0W8E7N7_9ZZZZ